MNKVYIKMLLAQHGKVKAQWQVRASDADFKRLHNTTWQACDPKPSGVTPPPITKLSYRTKNKLMASEHGVLKGLGFTGLGPRVRV